MNTSYLHDNGEDEMKNGETQALTGDLRRNPDYASGRTYSPISDSEGNLLDDNRISTRSLEKAKNDTSGALFGLNEKSSVSEKIYYLSCRSAPVIISFFLSLSGSLINLLFAGRFVPTTGDRSVVFAGISLGNMFANVTCFSLLIGMSSAIETLGSQHNGAGIKHLSLFVFDAIFFLTVIVFFIALHRKLRESRTRFSAKLSYSPDHDHTHVAAVALRGRSI